MPWTIALGSCVQVQGTFVRELDDGRVAVKVGDREFRGHPIATLPHRAGCAVPSELA